MEGTLLGIDIGGTNINIGRIKNGTIEQETFRAVDKKHSQEKILSLLFEAIDALNDSSVIAIGIGVPGTVDQLTGIIYDIQNIPVWKEIALKKILENKYSLPVSINNDANCFALGEKIFGKGKNYKNFIALSIGTGIGAGIIIDNKLYNGHLCGAGEIGMLPYKEGIIEDYAGSFFFSNKHNTTVKEFSEKATAGDENALQLFNDFGVHVGAAVKAVLYLFSPDAIIIGGSISKAYPLFQKSVEHALQSFAYQKQIQNLKIEISNQSGVALLGAASLCLQNP
ncbi:ROK family protein [Polaribacter irgensii 23-P]|uniref:ROK family protein n=1 Tax=Polaribacter irgensii 23-P TaxID=313594 RepID=A4BX51_9FLAO|nr:ROK family protein [Polaribacter irgensii]EAR13542.1 ROK family protein [Polaribacter irgensii 23-P]